MTSEYLRTEQAAEFLNLSKSALEKFRIRGEGPTYLKGGKIVLYKISDLREWLESRRFQSTSQV